MGIRVIAQLTRSSATYVAGETLECNISFESTDDKEEFITWASAQVHCQEVLGHNIKNYKQDDLPRQLSENDFASGSTSFVANLGEHGNTIYSSNPEVLCCNVFVSPSDSQKFVFRHVLPIDCTPPSFRGVTVKYLYKVTVGVQLARKPVKLLRIPFRVLSLTGCYNLTDSAPAETIPPETKGGRRAESPLTVACRTIELATCQPAPKSFRVADDHGEVCVISMHKRCFKLGDDVSGVFTFGEQTNNVCTRFTVLLQTVEELNIADSTGGSAASSGHETTYGEQSEYCSCYKECQFKLQIPTSSTPSFFTELVNVKWRLKFEFDVGLHEDCQKQAGCLETSEDGGVTWTAPRSVKIRRLVWYMPLKVLPCSPAHVDQNLTAAERCRKFILII